jgi:hypothetical protein
MPPNPATWSVAAFRDLLPRGPVELRGR